MNPIFLMKILITDDDNYSRSATKVNDIFYSYINYELCMVHEEN